ncbi:MAG TPA: glycosyltransferase [Solirubrobacteraceae bacterium]|jgi:rhamnosyltransferase|nr:glycosyltransferase [Solirubrobacteraceae bacterium]
MRGVSVIIRVRDERPNLARCLGLLAAQRDVGETELIVVDAGSRDGSQAVARAHGAQVLGTDPAEPFSYGGALNLGAERARHDVLVSLSAHAFPRDQGWLARLAEAMAGDPGIACACGDVHGPDGGRLGAPIAQDAALARRRPEWGYSNAAGAFRAELWRRRPFRADLPACEDKEWALHWLGEGYRCRVDPALAVDHDHTHDSLRAIYGRARREAQAYAAFLPGGDGGPGAASLGALAREWWSDTRWYDSALRARLSHRRAARLLGAYHGMSG